MAEQLNPLCENTGTVYCVYYCLSKGFKVVSRFTLGSRIYIFCLSVTLLLLHHNCLYIKPPCYDKHTLPMLANNNMSVNSSDMRKVSPLLYFARSTFQRVCVKNTQFWKWALCHKGVTILPASSFCQLVCLFCVLFSVMFSEATGLAGS